MTRWDMSLTLVKRVQEQRDDGSWAEAEPIRTKVWANRRKIGSSTWLAARSAGLHADASVQIRSFEYDGQEDVEIAGIEYTVEKAVRYGEFTVLTLAKRLPNG